MQSKKLQDLAQENMFSTDEEIVRRILSGEKRAFEELVNRHKDKSMTLALRMLKDREDAEEALQDAFFRAYNALARFEWKASFSTWLYRIVYNVCASTLARRSDAIQVPVDDNDEQFLSVPSEDATPDIVFENQEIRDAVITEIERLPGTYAGILTLFLVHDQSYEQIVEVSGLPLATVKVRLFRGRLLLRDALLKRLGVTNLTML